MRKLFLALAAAGLVTAGGGLGSAAAQTGYSYPGPSTAPSQPCIMIYPSPCSDGSGTGSSYDRPATLPFPVAAPPAYAPSFPTTYFSPYYWGLGLAGYGAPAPSSLPTLASYTYPALASLGLLPSYPGYGYPAFAGYGPGYWNSSNGYGYPNPLSLGPGVGYGTPPSYGGSPSGQITITSYQQGPSQGACAGSLLPLPC